MAVAGATGDANRIIEQINMERILDGVGPELRAWLKEQKPQTTDELGNLANLHVQSRKGPLVGGKYVNYKSKWSDERKEANSKSGTPPIAGQKPPFYKSADPQNPPRTNPVFPPGRLRPPVKCYKCGKEGHMSFNCNRGRGKPAQGYLLCLTPLTQNQSEFPGCNVHGNIEGRPAEMVVDSGCTRTLVHSKYINQQNFTGDKITVLTASAQRITVPLAFATFKTERGKFIELVGVLDILPVDCLLGRSSYGRTLSREDVLDQWERNIPCLERDKDEAFVLTRRQKALEMAQQRSDELLDRENLMATKNLSKREGNGALEEGDLPLLFKEECATIQPKDKMQVAEFEDETPAFNDDVKANILDRSSSQLALDQQSDVTLEKALKEAKDLPPKDEDGYFTDKEILMHRKVHTSEANEVRYSNRIVVPESYRNEILRIAHSIPFSGHMGSKKTFSRITSHFFWPGLRTDVSKYCATCPQCQIVARKMKSQRAPLQPTQIVTEPFKKIAIDIVGELPRSTTGHRYILTIVDYATRYPAAIPLRSVTSKAVADALIQYFCMVGIPDELVSDQGSNFVGKLMTQLYEQLGICKIKTSVYHPEANGLVERFNGTLKSMLKKFVAERVQTWDKYLPYLLFAYREIPNESTGYSPFELLYGRSVRKKAVELFRYYLYGRKFTLQTDHNPLTWLYQVRDKNNKLLSWSVTLQEYDINFVHKSGKEHVNADALSRV